MEEALEQDQLLERGMRGILMILPVHRRGGEIKRERGKGLIARKYILGVLDRDPEEREKAERGRGIRSSDL